MKLDKLIAALFLIGCASTQETVKTAIKAVESCEYLHDYAQSISDALNAKDYNLAVNIANAAYLKSLEDSEAEMSQSDKAGPVGPGGQNCINAAKDLKNQAEKFILESDNKEGVGL